MNENQKITGHLSFRSRLRLRFERLRRRLSIDRESSSKGQGLVEFALVLPVLLLLIMGIIEFSYVFAVYTGVFNAAREGVRYGVTEPRDVAGITLSAREKIFLVNPHRADVAVAYDDGPDTEVYTDTEQLQVGTSRVLVLVSYDLPAITPVVAPLAESFHIETQSARTIASLGDRETASAMGWGEFGGGGEDPGGGGEDPGGGGEDPGGGGGGGGGGGTAAVSLNVSAEASMAYSGDPVVFTYVVQNVGTEELSNVTIEDSFGNILGVGNLAPGATATRSVSIVSDVTYTNNVSVTGTDPGGATVGGSDFFTVTIIYPAMSLTATVDPLGLMSGEQATFYYALENTGDAVLSNVTLADSFGGEFSVADIAVGETVCWEAVYFIYETVTNQVTARAEDPLGGVITDTDEAGVVVFEAAPIQIAEPLVTGQTLVTGTAQTDTSVFIYDPEDPSISGEYSLIGGHTQFSFAVPALQPNHVIIVAGYGRWDSAVVQGEFLPIEILTDLCHGDTVITGTAQPGKLVTLSVSGLGYEDTTTVGGDGIFSFELLGGVVVQTGQTVTVSGYDQSDSTNVVWCGGTDAYIVVAPQCGLPAAPTTILVDGYNWGTSNNRQVRLFWNDQPDPTTIVSLGTHEETFVGESMAVSVPAYGEYTVRAELWVKSGNDYVSTGVGSEAAYVSPCPSPNLIITDLELLTTGVISTHQPLQFQATVVNTGTMPFNGLFWVDLFSSDPTSLPEGTPGFAWGAVSAIDPGETVQVVIAWTGYEVIGNYHVWALADSLLQVEEYDETDNHYGPLLVVVSGEGDVGTGPPAGTGAIMGETQVLLAVEPVPHKRAHVWCIDAETGDEVASTISDEDARYELSGLAPGTYLVMAETWIDGVRYFGIVLSPIEVVDGGVEVANVVMTR
jgi:Flp pilus assembly protein TadG